jgi:hypothetical protein
MSYEWMDVVLDYAVYILWFTLFLVLLLIVNARFKKHQRAKLKERNPEIHLYSYEYPKAKGEISLFFEADDFIPYELFLLNTKTQDKRVVAHGVSKKGGQKISVDTTQFEVGLYYYGIITEHQRIDKKLEIVRD